MKVKQEKLYQLTGTELERIVHLAIVALKETALAEESFPTPTGLAIRQITVAAVRQFQREEAVR